MTVPGVPRFERVVGRALVELPPFRLEDRRVELLVPGEAEAWVTLPVLDEAAGIGATLASLEAQTLRPMVVCVVDNGSRDGTPDIVRRWAASVGAPGPRRGLGVRLVVEPEKGTGAASDTGMRLAAAAGARYLLRTDADSLPRPSWAARMVKRLATDADLVAGRMVDREDEGNALPTRIVLWLLCETAIVACDLAEVIGTAIALQLLFGLPLVLGVCLTAFDVLLLCGK